MANADSQALQLIETGGLKFLARPGTSDAQSIKEVVTQTGYRNRLFDVQSGEHWLDLGLNVGAFTCYACAKGASVTAYEPEPNNHAMAEQNVAMNGFQAALNRLAVVNDDYPHDTANLYLSNTQYGQWRNSLIRGRKKDAVAVKVIRFSDLPDCDGMKMDIEGAELPILEQADFSRIPKLVFEYHFDIDPLVSRYRAIVERMATFYQHVKAPAIKPEITHYTFFPPAKIVFCWND